MRFWVVLSHRSKGHYLTCSVGTHDSIKWFCQDLNPGEQGSVHCKAYFNPKTELMQTVQLIRTFFVLSSPSPSAAGLSLPFSHLHPASLHFYTPFSYHSPLIFYLTLSFGYLSDSHFLWPPLFLNKISCCLNSL